jgi:hypothetical protein
MQRATSLQPEREGGVVRHQKNELHSFTIHRARLEGEIQMKKFVTILCAVALVATVSCKKQEAESTETVVTDTVATDTASVTTETTMTTTISAETDTSASSATSGGTDTSATSTDTSGTSATTTT